MLYNYVFPVVSNKCDKLATIFPGDPPDGPDIIYYVYVLCSHPPAQDTKPMVN